MGTCGSTCGITRERERQKVAARTLCLRAFPEGLDAPPAWWPEVEPFDDDELAALARAFEDALPCRACATVTSGARWIYLVATTDDASWVGLREGVSQPPEGLDERALRVGFSALGRYATLQEVTLSGAPEGNGWWVEESRCVGVVDRRFAAFVKAAQGILRSRRVVCLDAAFLAEPLDDAGGGTAWECLFDRDPMDTRTAVLVG